MLKETPANLPTAITNWVAKNITKKVEDYLDIAALATSLSKNTSASAPYQGPSEFASLAYIKGLDTIRIGMPAGTAAIPGFQAAVSAAIPPLQLNNPRYDISVVYK